MQADLQKLLLEDLQFQDPLGLPPKMRAYLVPPLPVYVPEMFPLGSFHRWIAMPVEYEVHRRWPTRRKH